MNDGLPTDERLDRIERGVQRRIDARRATRQGVARGVTAVLVLLVVVGGGFALLRSTSTATSSGAAGSAARPAASAASALVPVTCHDGRTVAAKADGSGLPASALAACALAERGATVSGPHAASGTDASATPSTGVLCRTKDGELHVYPGLPSACATHGMAPYPG